jgi:NAD(P)-dependent dehydrogenase (short-subunit alcohol dehydrogenase family)
VTESLQDKIVVVSGASTGIGRAAAERFASEGAHVVLLARRKERLADAAGAIGDRAVPVACDIADPDSVRAAFGEVADRFGQLDVLLNVAGAARVRLIEEATDDDILSVVGTNFLGPIYTTRAAVPLMRAAGGGDILNISSEVTLDDMPLMTLYSSTKRALNAFSQTMTKELRSEGIRVTLVVMGTVGDTSFGDNFGEGDAERAFPLWVEDGYLTRVAGAHAPMEAAWVADAMVYAVTRPRGMMLDVLHTRAAGGPAPSA